MHVAMSRAPKKPAAKPRATTRKLSALTEIGERAKYAAMREALLTELRRHDWNLTHTAEALRMGTTAAPVWKAIRELDLSAEYEKAKARGKAQPGRPKPRE